MSESQRLNDRFYIEIIKASLKFWQASLDDKAHGHFYKSEAANVIEDAFAALNAMDGREKAQPTRSAESDDDTPVTYSAPVTSNA